MSSTTTDRLPSRNPFNQIRPGMWVRKPWYQLGRTIVQTYAGCMFRMDVVYQVPLATGSKILAANHPSTTDPLLMTTLLSEQISILINQILFRIPVVGASLRACGHICVDMAHGRPAMAEAERLLKDGGNLGIFPEGEISPAGSFHRPHTGVARLAIASGAPVIPIGIYLDPTKIHPMELIVDGKTEIGNWYTHGAYAVTVGAPIVFNGDPEDREYVRWAADQIMQRITVLTQESARRTALAQQRAYFPSPAWAIPALVSLVARSLSFVGKMI